MGNNRNNHKVQYMNTQKKHWEVQVKRLAGDRKKLIEWKQALAHLGMVEEIIEDLKRLASQEPAAIDLEADMVEGDVPAPGETQ